MAYGGEPGEPVLSDEIEIGEGTLAERAFALDLGKRTIIDSVAAFRHRNETLVEASYEMLVEYVFAQSCVFLVARRAEQPVGFVIMLDTLPDEITRMPQGFIAYMAVEPASRRSGVAARLLAAAEDEARRRGLPYMGLMVTEDNAGARALYERAGYVTERRLLCKTL